MKVVDLADEIYRELGSPSDLSIAPIAFWCRTNIGALNNSIMSEYVVDETTLEIQEPKDGITTAIGLREAAIFKKMYLIHYYDTKIISTLTAASTDSVVELESDGSRIRKLDKTQQSNAYIRIKKLELEQLQDMITQYKLSSTSPLQVAGDDSIEGVYSRTTEFNRIKYQ